MTTLLGFFEARAEIQNNFCRFFGSNENFKICFRDLLTFSAQPEIPDILRILIILPTLYIQHFLRYITLDKGTEI